MDGIVLADRRKATIVPLAIVVQLGQIARVLLEVRVSVERVEQGDVSLDPIGQGGA